MAKKNQSAEDGKGLENSRFASIQKDPRFKLPRRKSIKGDLDTRFKSALTSDQRFTKKASIDKYGRRVRNKDSKKELSRYYNFDEEDKDKSDGSESDSEAGPESEPESSNESESDSEAESEPDAQAKAPKRQLSKRQLMRGEGVSDMSSDESSDEELEDDLKAQIDEYEQIRGSKESVPEGEESRRIAVVNMDWDNITSTDLMATFSSFIPPNRRILSVKIFPSEYGKKRMRDEEVSGPPQELFDNVDTSASPQKPQEVDEDQDYSSTRLRKYQLQRLQYYYAVIECDNVGTAAAIYDKCDGTEYESTANFFDLRYIPDEVEFTDKPRDECHKIPASYQPTNFTTDALQHSKVKLTWDETPKERARMAQKAFSQADMEDLDLKAYLASDSEGSDGDEDAAAKYRALLGNGKGQGNNAGDATADSDGDGGVEITFNPVLEGKEAKLEVVNEPEQNNSGNADDDNITTIEKYRLKEKERRQRRMERSRARKLAEQEESEKKTETNNAELELLAMDDDISKQAQSTEEKKQPKKKMTKTAAKKQAQNEAEQEFDTQDPRFQALFEDPDFAIDSTLPQFKKTKAMEDIIQERRRRQDTGDHSEPQKSLPRKRAPDNDVDTAQLVSKLRRKHAR